MKFLLTILLLSIFTQFSDSLFLFKKRRNGLFGVQSSDNDEDNSVGGGGNGMSRLLPVLLTWVSDNKPELLPVLMEFAIENPQILRMLTGSGGMAKRDTSSQVEYNTEATSDPVIVRRMFEFVLDNDDDDCFKKYVCGLTREISPDSDQEEDNDEENEPISVRQECSAKFSKCPFKEYKSRDAITVLSDRQALRQISD